MKVLGKSICDDVFEWQEKLENCQYVGEIYLPEDKLNTLAAQFAAEKNILLNKGYWVMGTAMLVLAVNCAYHYYDNEGFWKHFCRLVKCDNDDYNHEYIGNVIEQMLKFYGLLETERKGPFRYVGAILEQSGVSKLYISKTAQIMRFFKLQYGWDYLTAMSYEKFCREIKNVNCSRYLKNFLCDKAGWQFFLQVSRLMSQYEEGDLTLSELEDLPGFQPGFWKEFVSAFGAVKRKKSAISLKPRLVYLAGERCLALKFPYPRYCKNIIVPANVTGWEYPLTKLTRPELFSEKYSGIVSGEDGTAGQWTIKGWRPDGMPALFDIKRGYIEANAEVPPGSYYLLAPEDYKITCSDLQPKGDVSLPGRRKYKAYLVTLKKNDVIAGYTVEYTGITGQNIGLSWHNPENKLMKYVTDNYFDTFEGSLPPLQTESFEPIKNKIVGLFYNIGNGTVRIKTKEDLKDFVEEVKRYAPVKGRVWLSNISRGGFSVNKTVLDDLYFCLLPQINLHFEEKIYGFGENVFITADKNSSCRLWFKNCKDESGKGVKWSVPFKENAACGSIVCGKVSVGIRIPVYRAGLFNAAGKPIRYLSLSQLKEHKKFFLTGYPDAEAELLVNKNHAHTLTFNHEGFAEIGSDVLQAAFDNEISELYLRCQGRKVSTGAVFVNLEKIKKSVYQKNLCITETEWGKNLEHALQLCINIVNKPLPHISLDRLPNFFEEFDGWFYTILACACVFDDTVITVGNSVLDWKKLPINDKKKRMLEYIFNCRHSGEGKSVDFDADMLPAVERWLKTAAGCVGTGFEENSTDLLIKWAADVNGKGVPKSEIARQRGGQLIIRAWKHYLAGEYQTTITIINNINKSSGFVKDLKDLLHLLVLLRMLRIGAAKEVFERINPRHKGIRLILETLMQALNVSAKNTVKEKETKENEILDGMLEILPLRSEDKILIKQCESFSQNYTEAIEYCKQSDDWLLMIIAIAKLSSGAERDCFVDKLINMRERIPASPEKNMLFDKLKIKSGGN